MGNEELRLSAIIETDFSYLPIDRLGSLVLKHLVETEQWNAYNFLNWASQRSVPADRVKLLSEALNWLISKNLVARNAPYQSSSDSIFVTRLGHKVLEEGLAPVRALERLDVELHPRLGRIKTQFLLGEYELAAFAAMREVEIHVRELIAADQSLVGRKLMVSAFREGGPLADGGLDKGERESIMNLFAGAIGTFKNPPSHRQVNYDDPTEASEVVLFADLLMRILDRAATRSISTSAR